MKKTLGKFGRKHLLVSVVFIALAACGAGAVAGTSLVGEIAGEVPIAVSQALLAEAPQWVSPSPDSSAPHSLTTPEVYVVAGNTAGAIAGVVIDGTGSPMAATEVQLWQGLVQIASTSTNSHGFYNFPSVSPGSYSVKYLATAKPATVTGGLVTTVDFT